MNSSRIQVCALQNAGAQVSAGTYARGNVGIASRKPSPWILNLSLLENDSWRESSMSNACRHAERTCFVCMLVSPDAMEVRPTPWVVIELMFE